MPLLILVLSFILDGVLSNFLSFLPNDLTLFTPLLTVTSIFLIYPFYKKQENKFYLTVFILGLLYDLFYTNLLFFNAFLFLLVALISKYLYKNFELSPLKLVFYIILIITIYETTGVLIILIYNLVPLTIYKLLYKITHSLILNIIYAELIYFFIHILPKKYKRISIN